MTVAAISQPVTFYGSVFGGEAVVQAQQVTDYYAGAIATIDSRIRTVADDQKPRVLVMQWHGGDANIASGRNVWQDDAITLAGGKNAAATEIDGSRSDVGIEQILKWDPDVLILSDVNQTTAKEVLVRSGWDQLSAAKNHRLYINPTGIYGFTSHVVEAFLEVLWMARTLHPDKFQDLDMHKETKHVLNDFYHYNVSDAEVDDSECDGRVSRRVSATCSDHGRPRLWLRLAERASNCSPKPRGACLRSLLQAPRTSCCMLPNVTLGTGLLGVSDWSPRPARGVASRSLLRPAATRSLSCCDRRYPRTRPRPREYQRQAHMPLDRKTMRSNR